MPIRVGAFAQYIVCKPFNVKVLPPDFPLLETSLIEILPGVIHAAELSDIGPNTSVLITGQGVSGLVLTQVVILYSPRALAVSDLRARNLELAREYGATHAYRVNRSDAPTAGLVRDDLPDGFDVVIRCLLEGDGMIDAIECAAVGGRIVMYGCIGVCNKPVDFFKVHRKRLSVHSTEPRRDIDMRRYFQEGVQMVVDGLVNTRQTVTHTVPLSDIARAFELRDSEDNDAIHVLVDCTATLITFLCIVLPIQFVQPLHVQVLPCAPTTSAKPPPEVPLVPDEARPVTPTPISKA